MDALNEIVSGSTVPSGRDGQPMNAIEVLSNRLVPGSDGSIEHVVVANDAVTIIRSTPNRGRPRVSRDNLIVGGVSCKILVTGLDARVNTVRHLVGGEARVRGAIFIPKYKGKDLKAFGTNVAGSPSTVVQHLIDQHCDAARSASLQRLAKELDGMFLPIEKLSAPPQAS